MAKDDDQTNSESNASADDSADSIPEVDAELVEEEPPATNAPFDDATPAAEDAATKRTLISPGVLFFAGLVIVSIAAGAIWYVTTGVYSNGQNEPRATPPQVEIESASETTQGQEPTEPAEQTTDDKVVNNAGAKAILQSSPPPATTETAQFPAPTEAIENAPLQAAAKSAAVAGDDEAAIEDAEAVEPPINFEFDGPPSGNNLDDGESALQETVTEGLLDDNTQQPDEKKLEHEPTEDGAVDIAPEQAEDISEAPQLDAAMEISEPVEANASENALVEDMRQRVAAFEASIASLQSELAETTGELSETRARLGVAQDEIKALRAEKAALKSVARQNPTVAGAVALNAIHAAVETGAPFATELAIVEETAPEGPGGAPAIAMLRPYADGGAPAMAAIRSEFAVAARAGLATANRENADGLMERYSARIAGLFNIRPASPQPGASPAAVISRAEHAVDQGDLAAAIAEIENLPAPAQDAMGDWVALARNRAQINAALTSLNAVFAEEATGPGTL